LSTAAGTAGRRSPLQPGPSRATSTGRAPATIHSRCGGHR
jgi:hypothetical protein